MVKKIIFLLIAGLIIYSAVIIAMPQYNYFAFKSEVKEILILSITEKNMKVNAEIMKLAEQYDIPITEDNIVLWQKNEMYYAKISWEETVSFLGLYEKTFAFYFDTSE
jgi:hypothetical protein